MESYSVVNDGIQELDIAEGLKRLLTDAGLTIELIIGLDYQDISELLNIDPYVGKLIFEAVQNVKQKRNQREIIVTK